MKIVMYRGHGYKRLPTSSYLEFFSYVEASFSQQCIWLRKHTNGRALFAEYEE